MENAGIMIGHVVASERLLHGWKQTDLAERAHVSRASVSRLENGCLISADQIFAILDALDLRIEIKPRRKRVRRW